MWLLKKGHLRKRNSPERRWREASQVHGQLATPDPRPNLATPQSTVEYFVARAKAEDFERAAYTLNLELFGDVQPPRAAELAEQLFYVLNQKLRIDWEGLPDRRDGRTEGSVFGSTPLAGKPRRNLALGTIDLDGRVVSVRVQRVKENEHEPVWLFSAQTVENISMLYERYGPSWLEQEFPAWAKQRSVGRIPVWQLVVAASESANTRLRKSIEYACIATPPCVAISYTRVRAFGARGKTTTL